MNVELLKLAEIYVFTKLKYISISLIGLPKIGDRYSLRQFYVRWVDYDVR